LPQPSEEYPEEQETRKPRTNVFPGFMVSCSNLIFVVKLSSFNASNEMRARSDGAFSLLPLAGLRGFFHPFVRSP
jgi:hypothetical protein